MSLAPDRILSHYRLVDKIGEGGMGVVWRARDTTLDREVAIKVLPDVVAADPGRLARLEREAKLLASLNHPNIATVYGFHESGGVRFLAMELVAGEALGTRLARGPMPVREFLMVGRQIAEALETAHEHGVIHRDLKPANILLGPEDHVKVLDFGLARAFEADGAATRGASLSPTVTSGGTLAGEIFGTAAYMSPEQARGAPVDKRSDIWSFGAVLWEMLTARRLFEGETVSDILAAVLREEIDWNALPKATTPAVRHLLERCLTRDRKQRLHDMADARIEIEEILARGSAGPAAPSISRPGRLGWIAAIGAAAFIALGLGVWIGPRLARAPLLRTVRLDLTPPAGTTFHFFGQAAGPITFSPDGSRIGFTARTEAGETQIWVRSLGDGGAVSLAGTERGWRPFWSPDGEWIGFFAEGKLRKVPARGGPVSILADAPTLAAGRGTTLERSSTARTGRAPSASCRRTAGRRGRSPGSSNCRPT